MDDEGVSVPSSSGMDDDDSDAPSDELSTGEA